MSSVKKYVVFDFGSVLRVKSAERKETEAELVSLLNRKLREIKSTVIATAHNLKKLAHGSKWNSNVGYGRITRREGFESGFRELGITDQDFLDNFTARLDFENRIVPKETKVLLRKLKLRSDVELAILSNHSNELRSWLTDQYNLVPTFFDPRRVVISAEEGVKKPDPKIFQILLNTLLKVEQEDLEQENTTTTETTPEAKEIDLTIDTSNILFVDNRYENCEAARRMFGMQAYCYKYKPERHSECVNALNSAIFDFLDDTVTNTTTTVE